jgi:pimeloyl-ACP methyl ester carboxylesterase
VPIRDVAHRRLLATCLLGLAALTLSACTATTSGHATHVSPPSPSTSATPSATPSSGAVSSIKFSDCSKLLNLNALDLSADRKKNLTFSCGKLDVPLNYDDPKSTTIGIQVLKVHDARQTKKVGDLLMNPGGPGAAGLTLPLDLLSSLPDSLLESFDLIGFDPRGVELSNPIDCVSNAQKDTLNALDPDVRTAAGFAQAKQVETAVATGCTAKYGAALADYNTVFTAMDMERIRIALGDPKLNYLGFSYGTELGTVYAHLYPTTIRVAVLDGAVDPTTDDLTSFANQLGGFESAFDQFAADCMKRPACAVLGDPRSVVYQLTQQANTTPIPSSKAGETRSATGGIVLTGVISALYDQSQWAPLGEALIKAQKGDSSGLFALADSYNERDANGGYSNILDANTTISCNDSAPGPTDEQISATAASWATQYPMFGLWGASSLFLCQSWQPVRHQLPAPSAVGSAPILVIGTIHDPATPYAGAGNLAKALTTGEVLTWNGEGHTAYTKSDCIDEKVNAYLIDATLPPVGTVCPA